ncbi:ABC transporter ATP-binding protein [Lentibacillus sp. N15]|uniref:ABC transporter ATP-binding protein n=1 Tax=Lentibacillus songyuanensis TaxID=3136161 RepID=UPI0031BB5F53
MLHVNQLQKRYGKKQILDNITFSANRGEVIGLVGENGAGKSTLLNMLATLAQPSAGSIVFNQLNYQDNRKKVRKQIGFVPQDIAVWDEFSVEENMVFFEKLSWKKKSKDALRNLCLDVNLDKWKEPVKTLSGGMKRKLNLAITLIHDPQLLLLDEPTAGIDLKSRKEIGTYLQKQATERDKLIMYTSHDMDEIINICDRIYCIGRDPFYYQLLRNAGKDVIKI